MKYFKFFLSLFLTAAVFYGLNTKSGSVPPMGKFLDPVRGFWQNEKDETIDGDVQMEGLLDQVTVHYDKHLIPHVFAQNDHDLYRAQGYITAKHRLWQMEFQTFAAAGRLSEIVGESALEYDRQQRRRGMVFGAENALKTMEEDPETKAYIEAYCNGVNDYILQLKPENYPVEYKLLDYKPELWTIKKTALLLMYMVQQLAGGDSDLEYTNALQKFGKERFDMLFPDFFDVNDPVIPKETDWSFIDIEKPNAPQVTMLLDTLSETMDKPHPDNGSNNWAVSGKKSVTGNPILANDPHLGLNLPSIWFVMQLSTPKHNTFGATLPGALGIISGFNNHISWGVTNATRDVKDWFKIEFKDGSRSEYKYDKEWVKTNLIIEEIKIRNKKTFTDTVVYTHHGPVTYDRNYKGNDPKAGFAMKWTGHIGGNNQGTFLKLNEAKNYSDYLNALKTYRAPAQNFAFASSDGDIAMWVQGLFPNKWEGQGKFLLDGSKSEHDWQGFIPQKFNAHVLNPERGFVSSANQHPADESYPFFVFNDGYETYRNRVINNFFRAKEKFGIEDFKALHNNNYNLKAAELLPHIFDHMDASKLSVEEKEMYSIIQSWNFYNEKEKTAPSIWSVWWRELYKLTWDEFNDDDLALDRPFSYQTVFMLKNHPDNEFMDVLETDKRESANDLFLITFKETVQQIGKWAEKNGEYSWGRFKATYVGHLLQALPAFSRFDIPIGGDGNCVNAASKNHGPSWRMIVEMSSPPKAIGIYPGGQSGNPGSKYYDNFIDDWANGEYLDILFLKDVNATKDVINTQNLNPQK